jgi:Protein of unknown function (DUF3052)
MAGYSKTPLIQKLGIKAPMRMALLRVPASVARDIGPLPQGVKRLAEPGPETDYIHYFAEDRADLDRAMPKLKASLSKQGMLWISWRKGRVYTDLTENFVREVALKNGLVDVKVCAVDEKWSGLKLVYRLKNR